MWQKRVQSRQVFCLQKANETKGDSFNWLPLQAINAFFSENFSLYYNCNNLSKLLFSV